MKVIVEVDESNGTVSVENPDKPDEKPKPFYFDRVFDDKFVFFLFIFKE
jgi:hypothetical protein